MSIVKAKSDLLLQCKKCSNCFKINAGDIAYELVNTEEREMGAEYTYEYNTEYTCSNCKENMGICISVYEYPVGCLNLISVDKLENIAIVPEVEVISE